MGNGVHVRDELETLSAYVWGRTRERLDGLADDEYLWEPAPGCWSLRERPGGSWRVDLVFPTPAEPPFTTLAWRIAHLIQCYGQRRNAVMLGLDDGAPDVPWRTRASGSAAEAIDALDRGYDRWSALLSTVDDEALAEAIGSVGGPYAAESRAAFALHMLDEVIHHGAEVSTLRDLHRATTAPAAPPTTIAEAAARGRWTDVIDLVAAGAAVDNRGTTALHHAAGAGEAEVVELLLAHGADAAVRDPGYGADAAGWARYFGHPDLAARLGG